MSRVAETLRAQDQALAQRWAAALDAAGREQGGALSQMDLAELALYSAALVTYLRNGDLAALRRNFVSLISHTPQLRLAATQRELLAFRGVATGLIEEYGDFEAHGAQARREIHVAAEQAALTLAETYQVAVSDLEQDQNNRIAELEEKLAATVTRDTVTGVFTRAFFRERLNAEWRIAARYQRPLSLIIVTIDQFETLSNYQGGDQTSSILRQLANALVAAVRSADLVARVASDRFAMALPETDGIGANMLAERLCESMRELESETPASIWRPAASIGVADHRDDIRSADQLYRRAEAAMIRARGDGGDRAIWAADRD